MPKTVEQLCGILHMYFGIAPLVIASRSDSRLLRHLLNLYVFQYSSSCVCDCYTYKGRNNLMYNRDSANSVIGVSQERGYQQQITAF